MLLPGEIEAVAVIMFSLIAFEEVFAEVSGDVLLRASERKKEKMTSNFDS